GGDELPVGIARGEVTREGPDVGHIGGPLRIALDHVARLVAGYRNKLRDETHRDLGGAAAQLGAGDVGLLDRDEPTLDGLALGLALADRGLETVVDLAR